MGKNSLDSLQGLQWRFHHSQCFVTCMFIFPFIWSTKDVVFETCQGSSAEAGLHLEVLPQLSGTEQVLGGFEHCSKGVVTAAPLRAENIHPSTTSGGLLPVPSSQRSLSRWDCLRHQGGLRFLYGHKSSWSGGSLLSHLSVTSSFRGAGKKLCKSF